jgi:hypothetical protein
MPENIRKHAFYLYKNYPKGAWVYGFSLSLFFRRKVTKRSAKPEGSARTLQAHAQGAVNDG